MKAVVLCVQKKKQTFNYSKVKTRSHRQYLHDFVDGESDLLANSSVSPEVNYKILKKKQKIEEKIPMWTRGRTIAWDEIEIGWGL